MRRAGGPSDVRIGGFGTGFRSGDTVMIRRPHETGAAAARLVAIKAVHSAVFWVELVSIGWLVVSGARGRRDRSVAIAAGLVAAESVVWLANDRICPLTPLAERYGAIDGSVSDIWLPDVVARTIPQWSISLVAVAALLHLRGVLRR